MSENLLDGLKVLVLEDEFLIALDVEQLCREHGAQDVIIMRRLEELCAGSLPTHGFNVAIVDVRLGGETTFDFARQLSSHGIPFVFATGYSETESLFEMFPGVAVVSKPYVGGALMAAVRTAMQGGRPASGSA
ncbi:MAG: response regulator [Rhizobiaceae bacterium]